MNNKTKDENILIYTNEEGNINVEVLYSNENIWLNTTMISKLFDVERPAVTKHINNIYEQNELNLNSTCSILEHVGKTGQKYKTKYYNLDMIISIGFRINSKKAISFRTWANKIIKDYMIQGFALDDNRFLKGKKTDREYFERLLEKIKLIRASERMFYQKITDIFAECSIDYNKDSQITNKFYKTIQNKFHYAITGNTAAEIIYNRVNFQKDNMGLTNWQDSPDGKILKSDVIIAKNYLDEQELKKLNNIVNIFLDIAEDNASRNIPMYMKDWEEEVNNTIVIRHYNVLGTKGKITHKQAVKRAETEYDKYKLVQDREYISDFDNLINEISALNKIDN